MAGVEVRPSSPSPSVSLLEIKAETRLVLKSFLRQSLSIPPGERPGRIGGEYNDPNKYSAQKDKKKKDANGWDSLDAISAAEEKKHGIKNLFKTRLRARSSTFRHGKKDSNKTPSSTLDRPSASDQPDKPSTNGKHTVPTKPDVKPEHHSTKEEKFSPSSASDEDGDKKLVDKNKKKKKTKLADLFRRVSMKKEDPRPQRPSTLSLKGATGLTPNPTPSVSPTHPPEFYDGVAETLDRIAQKHSVKKKSPVKPEPLPMPTKDKEVLIHQLVQILNTEADAINEKINTNPFLRSTFNRLSYPSFAKLLDTYASQSEEPPLPARVSPTLRRLAITMDVSRRVVTATGAQRLTGYAERYMESFAPWVRSQGGWEHIAQEDPLEFD